VPHLAHGLATSHLQREGCYVTNGIDIRVARPHVAIHLCGAKGRVVRTKGMEKEPPLPGTTLVVFLKEHLVRLTGWRQYTLHSAKNSGPVLLWTNSQ